MLNACVVLHLATVTVDIHWVTWNLAKEKYTAARRPLSRCRSIEPLRVKQYAFCYLLRLFIALCGVNNSVGMTSVAKFVGKKKKKDCKFTITFWRLSTTDSVAALIVQWRTFLTDVSYEWTRADQAFTDNGYYQQCVWTHVSWSWVRAAGGVVSVREWRWCDRPHGRVSWLTFTSTCVQFCRVQQLTQLSSASTSGLRWNWQQQGRKVLWGWLPVEQVYGLTS